MSRYNVKIARPGLSVFCPAMSCALSGFVRVLSVFCP